MANTYFQFKQFLIHQDRSSMKVCTDSCLFGAWTAGKLEEQKEFFIPKTMLDIGTGTGLLSMMIAQKTQGNITAVEIEPASFAQAQENVSASPWYDRIKVIQADILEISNQEKYDFIFSNPPFFENDLKSDNHRKNLAKHQDALSLNKLLLIISRHLTEQGQASVLLPFHRIDEALNTARECGLFVSETCTVRHTPAHPFFRVMLWFSKKEERLIENKMSIRDSDGHYSNAFRQLLDDYYLNV